MKQMHPPAELIVKVELTGSAELLHPIVFKEGEMYCCLLGSNAQTGVMGCGDTAEQSVTDFDNRLKEHLANAPETDEIVQYVKQVVSEGQKPKQFSDELAKFLSVAIRPPRK